MNINVQQITGLILAGGRGRRVGEQDKGLLCFQDKLMIERQLDWFSGQLNQIVISANRNLEKYQSYGLPVLQDSSSNEEFSGPLSGVFQGLKYCTTEWLYVQPVDMPFMPTDVIELLCNNITSNKNAYFLKTLERSHYLSLLISTSVLSDLEKFLQSGNTRVRDFLALVGAEALKLGLDEKYFKNLNEFSDYG